MAEIAGLKLIVPSSVAGSGVSVSASGKVTFTAATSISVNGCFDSTYDNYLIVIRDIYSSGNIGFLYRLRASGSDASGSDYTYQRLGASSTTVSGGRTSSTSSGRVGDATSTSNEGAHLYVYGPALAQPTASRSVTVSSYLSAYIFDIAGTHSLSTAYDGITIYVGSGNITGALTIYGLAN